MQAEAANSTRAYHVVELTREHFCHVFAPYYAVGANVPAAHIRLDTEGRVERGGWRGEGGDDGGGVVVVEWWWWWW
jgi:hypothetical protein